MKRIVSILLTLVLVMSGAVPVFADTDDSAAVEKAVKYVKSIINVPEELTEFDYSSWKDEESNVTMINLYWYDEDFAGSLNVSVDSDNNLYSMDSYYEENDENKGFGNISKEQGQKTAQAFLNKAFPALKGSFISDDFWSYGQTFDYSFAFEKNGIPVMYNSANVSINKFTGEVASYYGYDMASIARENFEANQNTIGLEAAKKAYMENKGVQLKYYTNYDWETHELKVFPAYSVKNDEKYIDAQTGKLVERYNSYYYNGKMMAGEEAASDGGATLTRSEQEEIEKTSGLLSEAKAIQEAIAQAPNSLGGSTIEYSRLYKNDVDDNYYWNLGFTDGSVDINAETGELTGYYSYDYSYEERVTTSVEKAKATAESYLKKVADEKYAQTVFEEASGDGYNFVYARQVNGISCDGNYLLVYVDSHTGKINNYNCVWYDNVEFPKVTATKTTQEAFNTMVDFNGFDLAYIRTAEKAESLVYTFLEDVNYLLNPVTLERMDMYGADYKDVNKGEYTDISGKWYEDVVTKLQENGYYIEGEQFNGNNLINQEQFLRFLYSPSQEYYDQDEFYEMMENYGVIEKGEKAPDSLLTRQGAAKLVTRYLGLEKAGEQYGVYKNMYKDTIAQEYMGYASLAYALKIMQGDAKGRFNGTSNVTNAQAAVIIYNTLQH